MSKQNFAEFIIANEGLLRILRFPFFRKLEFFLGQINFVLYKIINHHQQRNFAEFIFANHHQQRNFVEFIFVNWGQIRKNKFRKK